MKSVFFFALWIFIPTFLLAQTETEPNDTFGNANPLTIGSGMNASINPANDNDYFKFTISQPGVVTIGVTNVPSNIGMDYWLYNINQQQIYFNSYNAGQNFSVSFLLCEVGTYYIRFKDVAGNAAQYTLLVKFDISDTYECNNSIPEAKQISLNAPVNASIWPASDEDFYKINITQPGVLTVAVNNIPANIGMDYWLYNINQQQIYFNSYNGGQNFSVPHLLCDAGIYYIRLRDVAGNAAQYTLLVKFDISDTYECNNSIPEAKQISLNAPVNASIWPASDEDYYKIEITEPGVLTVAISNIPANIGMDYWLYDPSQQQIYFNSYNEGQNFSDAHLLCDAGTYYIRLRDVAGNAAQYTLLATFDTSDIYECNQNFGTSKLITCNAPIFASINPANDADHYIITLTQPDIITVNVTNVPLNLDLTVGLFGPSPATTMIKEISGNTGASVSVVSPFTLPVGDYYIRVKDNKANANQYILTVKCPSIVSIEETPLSESVIIYPNPTNEMLYLDIRGNFNPNEYKIRNLLGELISTNQVTASNEAIDISKLAQGSYIIEVKGKEGRTSKQFVKI